MPSPVDKYFKQVKDQNPSYSDEQAWATAWSIYCKHKNPGSEHCHKPTSEYLKKALDDNWPAPPGGQRLFSLDVHATDIHSLGGPNQPLLREVVQGLVNEWMEGAPTSRGGPDGPRIGTIYGIRDADGSFALVFYPRHAQSVEDSMARAEAIVREEREWQDSRGLAARIAARFKSKG